MYKVLTLDGGGSWAVIQAIALKEMFPNKTSLEILNEFDFIAGTSGGALMLAGLLEFDTIDKVIEVFGSEDELSKIFDKKLFVREDSSIVSRYKTKDKYEALKNLLQNTGAKNLNTLKAEKNLKAHLLITAFDYDLERGVYFRSDLKPDNNSNISLLNAVHATSNAPIMFFDEPAEFEYQSQARRFWDGGVTGNSNPSLLALTEILSKGYANLEDIRILSIGTANNLQPIKGIHKENAAADFIVKDRDNTKIITEIGKMAHSILLEPMDATTFICQTILGGKSDDYSTNPKIIRMNPLVKPDWDSTHQKWVVPQGVVTKQFEELLELEMDAHDKEDLELIAFLAHQWIDGNFENQGIRYNFQSLEQQFGHKTFAEAKQAYLNW